MSWYRIHGELYCDRCGRQLGGDEFDRIVRVDVLIGKHCRNCGSCPGIDVPSHDALEWERRDKAVPTKNQLRLPL